MDTEVDIKVVAQYAWAGRKRAYESYLDFAAGAAWQVDSGEIDCGCKFENTSFEPSIWAKRAAELAAIRAGTWSFAAVIHADGTIPIGPCGACRQFLTEFDQPLAISSADRAGVHTSSLAELSPSSTADILDRPS